MPSRLTVDSFMVAGYKVPDAMPAQVSNQDRSAVEEYKIPLVVWMFLFLIVGYLGMRMLLED